MATKKPAKPIAGQIKQAVKDLAIHGQQAMFWGTKLSPCMCAQCGRKTVRGMIRVKQDKNYCSERCAVTDSPAV